ncbi:ACT domain-containing protein [Methanomassiliicoccaceae archaeon COG_1]|nr:ACT domain-containing protein [Methanomassiliicoccaceae archaeon COG_1]
MADRTIITLVGKDHTGIIAPVCNYCAENGINILDIRQTVMDEFITMMMLVDTKGCSKPFPELSSDLDAIGERVSCIVRAQHEDVFNMMHRI